MLKKLKSKFRIKSPPKDLPIKNLNTLVATWFGLGLFRPAPGTIGTLAGLPFGYAIAYFFGSIGLIIATILLFIIGTLAAHKYGKKSGEVDDQSIVVDEVVGLWIAALPAYANIYLWLLAVVLFRIFDIFKPWPASYFDKKMKNAYGVMLDDVMAGIYALFGVAVVSLSFIGG